MKQWKEPKFEITEPGEYACRDGSAAYVFAVLPKGFTYPIRGFLERSTYEMESWKRDGSYDGSTSQEMASDLVSKK